MRVLVTGAAGRLGRKLTSELECRHELVLGDVADLDDPRYTPLDVRDLDAVRSAAEGCDAVAHLAILDWPCCGPAESLRYAPNALQVHVVGLHNVLQAAREVDVRQFVYVSSVSVVDGLPPGTPVDSRTRHFSNAIYGMSKGFGEDLCRLFHDSLGLPVAILRLGNIFNPEGNGAWLGNIHVPELSEQSPPGAAPSRVHVDDATRAIGLALEAPDPGYALVHVVGADSGDEWDLEEAKRVYGWEPWYSFAPDGLPRPARPG